MQLVLNNNNPCVEPFVPGKDLKVLVACEGSHRAAQTCALLERLARRSEAEGRLLYSWWNFELLAVTTLRKLATSEAAEADMVVIAAQDAPKLSETVIGWIREWLAARERRAGALVALLDAEATKPGPRPASRGLLSQLKKFAEMGRMDFFANGTSGVVGGSEAALIGGAVLSPGNSS